MRFVDPQMALVIVWFGPLPFWMPAFLHSCRYNPGVDWIIFSDARFSLELPENVRFLPLTVDKFNLQATEILGFKVNVKPTYAYKMCDLKIMYGCIFENELKDYDFWGCCDMDVVWGDIRRFITSDILKHHDVITSRIGRISGHFCLFRNRRDWNELFRRIPNIAECVEDNSNCRRIDEDGLTNLLQGYQNSCFRSFFARHVHKLSIPRVYWDRVLTTSGKHQRQMLAAPSLHMRWCDGNVYGVHGEDMMYLHFHSIRKGMKNIDFGLEDAPREFVITTNGLFANTTELTDAV